MTTTPVFEDEADRERHIKHWQRAAHRYVDGGICEVCGNGMPVAEAYEWAESLMQEAFDTLESAGGSNPVDKHFTDATNIAIGAALEQLREDKP